MQPSIRRSACLIVIVALIHSAAPVQAEDPPIEWSSLQVNDLVYQDTSDPLASTCTRAESSGMLVISFSAEEVATMQEKATELGERVALEKTIVLSGSATNPCDLRVLEKGQRAWLCGDADDELPGSTGTPSPHLPGLPDDLATQCTSTPFEVDPEADITGDQNRYVEGRYRVMACCWNWWLTYQTTTLTYTSTASTALYQAGGFMCDGNANHNFVAQACSYQNWVLGPAAKVGFKSKGHYVQTPGCCNYNKYVGAWGHGGGGSSCDYDIVGAYPWSENNANKHRKSCVQWVDPDTGSV